MIEYKVIAKASCRVKVKLDLFNGMGVGYFQIDGLLKVEVAGDSNDNGFDECALTDD